MQKHAFTIIAQDAKFLDIPIDLLLDLLKSNKIVADGSSMPVVEQNSGKGTYQ